MGNALGMKCPAEKCSQFYTCPAEFVPHFRWHSSQQHEFTCQYSECQKSFLGSVALETHRHYHEEDVFFCDHCGKFFQTKKDYHKHLDTDHEPEFYCEFPGCYESLINFDEINHIQSHDNEDYFMCIKCGMRIKEEADLKGHMKTHTDELKNKCIIENCGRTFPNGNAVMEHVLKAHYKEL